MIPLSFLRHLGAGCATALIAAAVLPPTSSVAAPIAPSPAAHDAGAWDLSFEKGNRRCRLFLRTEPLGAGFAVAMPAVCHKAFPALLTVTSWSAGPGEHVTLSDAAGSSVFDFAPDGTPSLTAVSGAGDVYSLTPVSPALQDALRAAGPGSATELPAGNAATGEEPASNGVLVERGAAKGKGVAKASAAAHPALPPATIGSVAGHYAVLRQDRDTGCMVTLEASGRSASDLRARLAPACRDQGIVIFDPSGWQLLHGSELVLTAKRGHSTALTRRDDNTWANAPARGAPLVLKRL